MFDDGHNGGDKMIMAVEVTEMMVVLVVVVMVVWVSEVIVLTFRVNTPVVPKVVLVVPPK